MQNRCQLSRSLYVLFYVDDILVCGDDPLIEEFIRKPSEEVLLKVEGHPTQNLSNLSR